MFLSSAFAQLEGEQQSADTTTENRVKEASLPKVPKSFYIPTGLRLGTDLVALGVNAFGDRRNRYELQGDIDFHRFYLAGSYGIASYKIDESDFNYSNDGSYFRIGADVNFLKFDPDFNTLTFGLRYARASFTENLNTNIVDPIYGSYSESFTNSAVSARWFELTTGLRVMLFDNLYTGYTIRIQLNRKITGANEFRSYDIPGFGLSEFKNRWTFNYYLVYRIAWREKKLVIPGK
ncbi:hypothetical protein JKA74_17645 [Marivirga sp. S37H4]|uniref:Uncharacterized protein n=2 Tax=Marivirga aurantiaca TaxID=2802615 RepID=A0A934X1S7_9BACT|nr:hypothetical protein [Marivirga aurantiaca]